MDGHSDNSVLLSTSPRFKSAPSMSPHAFTVSQRALFLPGASGPSRIDFSTHWNHPVSINFALDTKGKEGGGDLKKGARGTVKVDR